MEIKENIKSSFSLCILAFVGALFVFKYSTRLVDNLILAGLLAVVYAGIFLVVLIAIQRSILKRHTWLADQRLFLFALLVLVVLALGIITLSPEASRVSRLFALNEWLARLLTGKYPWSLSIQYNPSGLPFLFLMALPFYLAGNLGLLEVTGVILFFTCLISVYKSSARWIPLIAFVLLPSFYYELLVRSELLFNISLVILLMILAERYLNPDKLDFAFFVIAALFGLVLSTRTVVGLMYAIYYVYKFRQQIFRGVLFAAITLLFFGLTLLPFIIWDARTFFSQGPLFMQLLHLPIGLAIFFVVVAVFAGWKTKSFHQVIFLTGVLLFGIVGAAFLLAIVATGVNSSVINDGFDITYFIFCVPLLLLSLAKPGKAAM